MKLITLSLLSLLATITVSSPVLANTKAKDQPKPNTVVKASPKYRTIKLSDGYKVANLYKNLSVNSEVLRQFKGGEVVKELETKGTMMKVTFRELTGWIVIRK